MSIFKKSDTANNNDNGGNGMSENSGNTSNPRRTYDYSFKSLAKKITLVGVVVCVLFVVSIAALFDGFASGKPPTSKHNKNSATDKQETISVYADANGKGKSADANIYITNNKEEAKLNDKSTLTEVENSKQKRNLPEYKSGYLKWTTYNKDVSYTGDIEVSDVPIKMNVAYYLDNKRVDGDDLYGKSGNLKIVITYDNTAKADVNGKSVTVPMTAINYFYVGSSMEKIKVSSGKVLKAKNKNIVIGIATPGLDDVLSARLFGLTTNQIIITGKIKYFEGLTMSSTISGNLLTYVDPGVFDKLNLDQKVIKLDAMIKKGLTVVDNVTATVVKYGGYIPWVKDKTGDVVDVIDALRDFIIQFLKDIKQYNKELTKDLEIIGEVLDVIEEEIGPLSEKEKVIIEYELLKKATDPEWTDEKAEAFEQKVAAMSDEEWQEYRDKTLYPEIQEMWNKLLPYEDSSQASTEESSEASPEKSAQQTESETPEYESETDKEAANDPYDHTEDEDILFMQEIQAEIDMREMQSDTAELDDTKKYLNEQKTELEEEKQKLSTEKAAIEAQGGDTAETENKISNIETEINTIDGLIADIDAAVESSNEAIELVSGEEGLLELTKENGSAVEKLWELVATNKLITEYFAKEEQAIKDAHPLDWESTDEWKQLKEVEKRYMKLDETSGKYVYMNPIEVAKQGLNVTAIIGKLIDDNLDDKTKGKITEYANLASSYAHKASKFVNKLCGIATKLVNAVVQVDASLKEIYNKYVKGLLNIYNTNLKGLAGDLSTAQQAELNFEPITGLTEGWSGSTTYYYEVSVGGGGNSIIQSLIQ